MLSKTYPNQGQICEEWILLESQTWMLLELHKLTLAALSFSLLYLGKLNLQQHWLLPEISSASPNSSGHPHPQSLSLVQVESQAIKHKLAR